MLKKILKGICNFLCWGLFLSISVAGQNFFSFQFDDLLLECGFLFFFFHNFHFSLKPFSKNPKDYHPPTLIFWLYRLLLFRILFVKGIIDILSPDRSWRSLSFFSFYFENQPSPTCLAWFLFPFFYFLFFFSFFFIFFHFFSFFFIFFYFFLFFFIFLQFFLFYF